WFGFGCFGRLGGPIDGPPDHDLVLFDRDLDRPVPGPMLGVDPIVDDGRIEPQPVALLAVVEGPLEWSTRASPASASTTPAAPPPRGDIGFGIGIGLPGLLRRGLGRRLGLGFGRPLGFGGFELGRDQRVVLGPKIDLVVEVELTDDAVGLLAVSRKTVLPLERLDLLDADLELVGDPCIRPALARPRADLIELRSKRFARHQRSETSAKVPGRPRPRPQTRSSTGRPATGFGIPPARLAICPVRMLNGVTPKG